MTTNRAVKVIRKIPEDASLQEVIKATNELIYEYNFLSRHLSLGANFDGQIIENIAFSAGETKDIPHLLGNKPKYRVILGQVGNGVLEDIPSGWNSTKIQVKNNGAVAVTATIMLVRE